MVYDSLDKKSELVITPVDLRIFRAPDQKQQDPIWLTDVYSQIKNELVKFPEPGQEKRSTNVNNEKVIKKPVN